MPTKARWITLKDTPVEFQRSDGTVFREFDQDGWLWQAEEVRKGDRWERSFGFVGHHVVGRVPAAEIELARDRFNWGTLAAGLDARIETVNPRRAAFKPGKPIAMIVRIRNRRGVEVSAPAEFLRRGEDGRPSLRRGVNLAASYFPPSQPRSGVGQAVLTEELKPKRTDHFEPGNSTRPLGPFEVFDTAPVELNDWFHLTRPGTYRVRVTFASDSGFGEGASNDRYVIVGESQASFP